VTRQVGSSPVTSYTSDANGNTLTDANHTNTWDSQNRLVASLSSGKTSAFRYGADGLRRKHTATATGQGTPDSITHYGYDGTNVVRKWEENIAGVLNVSATYPLGPSGPMYRRPANVTDVRWYVYDGLGSVVGEVDVFGNLTAEKKHDVYGLRRGTVGTEKSKHGFVGGLGHYSDGETGLVYMRARYYDPAIGRFVSEDPARDGTNWFNYCAGDPVNNIDLTGKSALGVALGLGIIGFLAGFFGAIQGDLSAGNPINWGNAFAQGGIWGAAGLAGGLLIVPVATTLMLLGMALAASAGLATAAVAAIVIVQGFILMSEFSDEYDLPYPPN
jgi:RHS repeat-associated protein